MLPVHALQPSGSASAKTLQYKHDGCGKMEEPLAIYWLNSASALLVHCHRSHSWTCWQSMPASNMLGCHHLPSSTVLWHLQCYPWRDRSFVCTESFYHWNRCSQRTHLRAIHHCENDLVTASDRESPDGPSRREWLLGAASSASLIAGVTFAIIHAGQVSMWHACMHGIHSTVRAR